MTTIYAKQFGGIFGSGGGGGGGGGGTQPKADIEPISSGAASVSVSFGTAFASGTVVVVAWLTTTDMSPVILDVIGTPATLFGFTATLSTQTPTANYALNWFASVVNDS